MGPLLSSWPNALLGDFPSFGWHQRPPLHYTVQSCRTVPYRTVRKYVTYGTLHLSVTGLMIQSILVYQSHSTETCMAASNFFILSRVYVLYGRTAVFRTLLPRTIIRLDIKYVLKRYIDKILTVAASSQPKRLKQLMQIVLGPLNPFLSFLSFLSAQLSSASVAGASA